MLFGPSVDGWEPERSQLIGIALACPSSSRPLDVREFHVFSLSANAAFLCNSCGTMISNEIANAITVKTRIISRRRKMSTICSFLGVLAFAFRLGEASNEIYPTFIVAPFRRVRVLITQIIKSDWPA